MAEKEQIVIMARPDQVDRTDTLRIVMGVSRAEVLRQVVDAGLPVIEAAQDERISRLSKLAARHKVTLRQVAVAYANRYSKKTYGATLEELENDRALVRDLLTPASP